MVDIMTYNELKLNDLKEKIKKCNGNYRLFCFDVDDVIFNITPKMQDILKKIDYRATEEYRNGIKGTSEDAKVEVCKSYNILDAILEEHKCVVEDEYSGKEILDFSHPIIDYNSLYVNENLFPLSIDFLKMMIKCKKTTDFFIFVSHRNPIRESIIKTQKLYELIPENDGVITLSYHKNIGDKDMSNKGLEVMKILGLDSLTNCILIDNSKTNGLRWRKLSGYDIRYLPEGFHNDHNLTDHMSKITNLDPYMIQFCIAYIEYARNHPEYPSEIQGIEKKIKLTR